LTQRNERFKTALAAYKVVGFSVQGFTSTSDGNRLLETDVGNVGHDALEYGFVATPRIQYIDLIDRNQLNHRGCISHAASGIRVRLVISTKKSSVLNR
jgi:hypothetical protein